MNNPLLNPPFLGFDRNLVGFEDFANDVMRSTGINAKSNYPPYNIVKYDNIFYSIELAVAGFSKNELTVETVGRKLTIYGKREEYDLPENEIEYLHKGISSRDFKLAFDLAQYVEVSDVELNSGILSIDLVKKVPDDAKPRKIDIK